MGGQAFKNHMEKKMDKEIEDTIKNISHHEEVEKKAKSLYMKWYEKNLLPFDYADKDDFVEYFTDLYIKNWEGSHE
jgi:hypothetical protein